ncbi:MAG: DNA repair protein RecN [Sphingomonadales bacterium]
MLLGLSIRDIVLIDRLDLPFETGLCVLTGETGAGKSIVLDSLGLVLGARADSSLMRSGAKQCSVSAEFEIGDDHPARAILREQGLELDDEVLVLRRTISAGGRSRAFVNDQPVSVSLLRALGDCLIEIHGQHGEMGLLNGAHHRPLLDAFGGLGGEVNKVRSAYAAFVKTNEALKTARSELEKARADEDYLRHAAAELDKLDPRPDEEAELAGQRSIGMHGEKVASEIDTAMSLFAGDDGIESRLRQAARKIERVADKAAGKLDPVLDALERAAIEASEGFEALNQARRAFEFDPRQLEEIEERLFALRAAARKHRCQVDDLPRIRTEMEAELARLNAGENRIQELEQAAAAARAAYRAAADRLTGKRRVGAKGLDKAIMAELGPLKLEKAVFRTRIEVADDAGWGPDGVDGVRFEVSTVPGAEPGPIGRIASGGELARFMLAIKVVLARKGWAPTLIFDEVDRGIGGAVADAVGERLKRLSEDGQIVVITHSPQVAARASAHWRVARRNGKNGEGETTTVLRLDVGDRREEIARMLAGARITDQARAAADSLIQG